MLVRSAIDSTDEKTLLLKALGKLADVSLSDDTRNRAIDEMTRILSGKPATKETFEAYGIEAESSAEQGKPEIVIVKVPSEYTGKEPGGEPAEVSFTITKVLNTDFRNR